MTRLEERLQRGEVLIMDGAMGTELAKRGVSLEQAGWSAGGLATHPQLVKQLHVEYIGAGADIIITNTFSASRWSLEAAGLGSRVAELNRLAVELAKEAVGEALPGRPVYIAGSVSTTAVSNPSSSLNRDEAIENYGEQAQILAEAGVDLLILEMMRDVEKTTYALEGVSVAGLPVWVGFSCKFGGDGSTLLLWDSDDQGPTLVQGLEVVVSRGISGVAIMHTQVAATAPALSGAKRYWQGPLAAYPISGRLVRPQWQYEEMLSPRELAVEAREWVDMGVQVVGGSCGIGPGPSCSTTLHQRCLPLKLQQRSACQ